MKLKEGKKKKNSFARKLKREGKPALLVLGVLALLYGLPFLKKLPQPINVPGYKTISFQVLSAFNADQFKKSLNSPVNTSFPSDLPPAVKALSGENVSIMGYMIPLDTDGSAIKTFALVRDQASCCFGGNPKLNEWVYVIMKPPHTAEYTGYDAVMVSGKLAVGASVINQGDWSFYRLLGDNVRKV